MTVAVREKEYTIDEMRTLLNGMSGMYDLARIVGPIECQVLTLQKDGMICMNESCYNIWNADRKCVNCSSAVACKTGCHQEKTEHFKDHVYHIQSNPVKLKLPDGGRCSVVMELVSIDAEPAKERKVTVNDRESENTQETAFRYLATYDTLTGLLKSDMFYEQAVRQLSAWKNTDWKDLTISVNVSAKNFYSMDIYRILTGLTEKYGVSNDRLRLEITESALVKEPERRHPILSRLQEAGFLIEIDDFGKGQSFLSLLKDIRADILKLDMGFLRETENRKRGQIILRTVITMANELGMQVIAESIETEKQLKSLSSMGCDHFQGYYFSRPIPVADFENKYKKQRPSA